MKSTLIKQEILTYEKSVNDQIKHLDEKLTSLRSEKKNKLAEMVSNQFNYKSITKDEFKDLINKSFDYYFKGEDELVKEFCKQFKFKYERQLYCNQNERIHLVIIREKKEDLKIRINCQEKDDNVYSLSFEKYDGALGN